MTPDVTDALSSIDRRHSAARERPSAFIPPLDTPGLTDRERDALRVAHVLVRDDAAAALGITTGAYKGRMRSIRDKYHGTAITASPDPRPGGLLMNGGVRRTGIRR